MKNFFWFKDYFILGLKILDFILEFLIRNPRKIFSKDLFLDHYSAACKRIKFSKFAHFCYSQAFSILPTLS